MGALIILLLTVIGIGSTDNLPPKKVLPLQQISTQQDTTQKVEAYDLRGKGYTDQQVGATALDHSKTKLVVVVFADTSNHKYQEEVLTIVGAQVFILGRKNIMVLFADKGNAQTFTVLYAKGKMLPGLILEKNDPGGFELTIAIRVTYDRQFGNQ